MVNESSIWTECECWLFCRFVSCLMHIWMNLDEISDDDNAYMHLPPWSQMAEMVGSTVWCMRTIMCAFSHHPKNHIPSQYENLSVSLVFHLISFLWHKESKSHSIQFRNEYSNSNDDFISVVCFSLFLSVFFSLSLLNEASIGRSRKAVLFQCWYILWSRNLNGWVGESQSNGANHIFKAQSTYQTKPRWRIIN